MGFRVRKSFKLAPGVRMTVTPRGVGVSAGTRGARVSAHSSGRVTRTVGIPGSGISHTSTTSGARRTAKPKSSSSSAPGRARTVPGTAALAPVAASPGLFAPRWEKELHRAAVKQADDVSRLVAVGQAHPQARPVAALLEAIRGAVPAGAYEHARGLVAEVFASGFDPATDAFVTKYLPGQVLDLEVADGVTAELPLDRDAVGLLLGELHQQAGDRSAAIDVVESLTPSTTAAVSLAELYAEGGDWAAIVELTDGLTNLDEPSTYLLVQRGVALREQGHLTAAREALKEALRVRSRPPALRHRAWLERANTYLAENKRSLARKDLERVLAENSAYPGLQDALAQLPD
ncbi:DUF4236 domain-containing protein [Pseudokineococcus lusitanus]|uniref:Uncharacterized protein DUF4236 n=1 Tax=Pseudokineococcus lusitanus TaxID=763993 RepID=A0A3N1HQ80_9ACTN|nr:DUF4236 domain-containing protein [Pseudokineococcus lusitanus]ROP44673.1 uncharacterized protein DUF4236 [Pseudokineococcus lusitanus]